MCICYVYMYVRIKRKEPTTSFLEARYERIYARAIERDTTLEARRQNDGAGSA